MVLCCLLILLHSCHSPELEERQVLKSKSGVNSCFGKNNAVSTSLLLPFSFLSSSPPPSYISIKTDASLIAFFFYYESNRGKKIRISNKVCYELRSCCVFYVV